MEKKEKPANPYRYLSETLSLFRPCFSREATFGYFVIILIGFLIRTDALGVSSFIRAFRFDSSSNYCALLHFFSSHAWKLGDLMRLWQSLCLAEPLCTKVNDRLVLIGDHTQTPKEGRKMPAVVTLHQHSETASKPSYFRGHCWAWIGVLIGKEDHSRCIPLEGHIDQGVSKESDDELQRSLTTRIVAYAQAIAMKANTCCYLVLDSYFAVATAFVQAAQQTCSTTNSQLVHLITRAKKNIVAYLPLEPTEHKKRGRPKKYGDRIKLYEHYENTKKGFIEASCYVYDKYETIYYLSQVLYWKPFNSTLLFVMAHTSRGFIVLMCSDLSAHPLDVIQLYCHRPTIEYFFAIMKNLFGGLSYHFWSKYLAPQSRKPKKNSSPSLTSDSLRNAFCSKLESIERFVNLCSIAVGICSLISIRFPSFIWDHNSVWLRTTSSRFPSEFITRSFLIQSLTLIFRKVKRGAILQKLDALALDASPPSTSLIDGEPQLPSLTNDLSLIDNELALPSFKHNIFSLALDHCAHTLSSVKNSLRSAIGLG